MLYEKLSEKDLTRIHDYIITFAQSAESDILSSDCADLSHILCHWDREKSKFLSNLFGGQLILEKQISIEQPRFELLQAFNAAKHEPEMQPFIDAVMEKVAQRCGKWTDGWYTVQAMFESSTLLSNKIDFLSDEHTPYFLNLLDATIKIVPGSKLMKTLHKIAVVLDLEAEFEAFRLKHSMVLNCKKFEGTLCLSIHPLDYLTMSDNWSGWSSCMQWMEEAGDYRLGTIEMMNSDYIVVAYVEAKDDMTLCNGSDTWNNKRWRQLLVITPDLILGNKQYPYNNDILQGTALKWLRRLAEATGSFGPYDEEAVQIVNHGMNRIGTRDVYVNLTFNYMYNDIYDHRLAFINSNAKHLDLTLNLSGYAACTSCGGTIYYDDVDPSWTVCRSCTGMWRCSHCGDWCSGEPYYVEDKDDPYCHFCYHNDTETCEICGDRVSETTKVYIELLPNPSADLVCFNWSYVIDSCWHCLEYGEFERYFGPAKTVSDMWGRLRKVVSIDTITDEGFELGTLGPSLARLLKEIRDAKSIEDRVSLMENKLC
jgi:hypothetical protein